MQMLPWIVAVTALALLAGVAAAWSLQSRRSRAPAPLPAEWGVAARPVFSTAERRVYQLLREALPHHIVLAKLPLVRFCHPADPNQRRFWYELLGATYMTFAICSANGRVLAAIDLDTGRSSSRRVLQIKRSVLSACRVRYLRCPIEQLPTVAELQRLVPSSGAARGGPISRPGDLDTARDALASAVALRRAERATLWQDSTQFHDSFFAADSRFDGFGNSDFSPFAPRAGNGVAHRPGDAAASEFGNEVAGIVVDGVRPAPRMQG